MVFGQEVVVKGGLLVLPCSTMHGNVDNCSLTQTSLFVALIRMSAYWLHFVVIVFSSLLSPLSSGRYGREAEEGPTSGWPSTAGTATV